MEYQGGLSISTADLQHLQYDVLSPQVFANWDDQKDSPPQRNGGIRMRIRGCGNTSRAR
jgi:hypothetical protein